MKEIIKNKKLKYGKKYWEIKLIIFQNGNNHNKKNENQKAKKQEYPINVSSLHLR